MLFFWILKKECTTIFIIHNKKYFLGTYLILFYIFLIIHQELGDVLEISEKWSYVCMIHSFFHFFI